MTCNYYYAMEHNAGLAFDGTARTYDKDGRLHIAKSHISKATVNPYYGSEIPNATVLGLDPNRVYYLFRDPIELARAASTFARLPILSKHIPISAQDHPAELVIGSIGSDVEFNDPYLDADVCIWEAKAIAGVETDAVREFSCAYRYTPVMTPGEYKGQRYDGIMTEIHGNHLILCETGRAGSDVIAADEEPKTMKKTKLGKALIVTLGNMSPKLAADSAMPALVGSVTGKTLNVEEVSTKLIAMDAAIDPKQLKATFDSLIALDAEKEEPAKDEEHPADCDCKECKKPAQDDEDEDDAAMDDEDEEKKPAKDADKEETKKAMDSFRQELREADEARRAVRDVVGEVIAHDSAAGIYGFALDQMKIDYTGVKSAAGRKAIFNAVKQSKSVAPSVIAQDAAGLVEMFPEASRFRQM